MNIIFKGKPLKVVEEMKNIQHNMNMYLEVINGIYQDLIIEYIDKDTKIFVAEDSYGELGYDKIGDEDNE